MRCPQCGANLHDQIIFCPECGARIRREEVPATTPPLRVLQGRYELRRRLGAGGMGSVYLATDRRLSTAQWAVKEMSDTAITSLLERQQAQAAFRQEAELLARLSHPSLPRVTDHFEENGRHYLVMEFVPGENLGDYVNRVGLPRPLHEVLRWTAQICEVLAYLHTQQPPIIFRDLKPTNIMITPEGTIKLVDFGIARLFKPGKERDTQAFGTPGYSAPEQYGRGQTDARSDIYSLGVLMHHLLTGHDPSTTPFRLPPITQLNPSVPAYIATAIARATDNDPSRRFASVIEFQQVLFGSQQLVNVQPGVASVASRSGPIRSKRVGRPARDRNEKVASVASLSGPIGSKATAVTPSTRMAIAGRWIGIICDVLMVVAIILVAFGANHNHFLAVFGIILAAGAVLFALIGGTLSLIALVSPNTAKTLHGRRDAAIGFASSSGAFLLSCVLHIIILWD